MPPVRSGGTRTKRESLVENAPASSAAHPAAHAVLARIFHDVEPGLRYRLWDGSAGEVGRPDGSFTIVIGSAGIFRKAFSGSDTGILAEAYATGEIDIEGDLRACLRIANQLEGRTFTPREKLGLWWNLRRLGSSRGGT